MVDNTNIQNQYSRQRDAYGYGSGMYGGLGRYGNRNIANPYSRPSWQTPNITGAAAMMTPRVQADKAQKGTDHDEIASWLETFNESYTGVAGTLAKVPPNMYNMLNDKVQQEYDQATEWMRIADSIDTDADPRKAEYMKKALEIQQRWSSLSGNLDQFLKNKTEFKNLSENGALSDGMSADDLSVSTKVFTDKANYNYDNQGNVFFNTQYNKNHEDGSIEAIGYAGNVNELKPPIEKDFAYAKSFLDRIQNLTKAKQPLSDTNKNLFRMLLSQELSNPNRLKSWLTDDFIAENGFGIQDLDLLNDPSRFDELKEMAVNQSLGLLENAANDGYQQHLKELEIKNKGKTNTPTLPAFIENFMKPNLENKDLTVFHWASNVFAGSDFQLTALPDGTFGIYDMKENQGMVKSQTPKNVDWLAKNISFDITGIPDLTVQTMGPIIKRLIAQGKLKA